MLTILKRYYSRNMFYIALIIFFFLLGFWTGNANASEPVKLSTRSELIPKRPEYKPSILITPTTTAPYIANTVKQNVTVQMVDVPAPPTNVTPEQDWVTQCKIWATQAGIELNDEAILLIDRESNCDPTILNGQGSGAGGIGQALPFSKTGCALEYTDEAAVCQLKWMHGYVMGRYGGWAQANRAWESRSPHWY